jgi:phosphoribosylformimino-5-aminoimidazole carboxamide ribotide isomerase
MAGMTIIPAIDLKDGRCVRLRQGRADDAKVYSEDPVAMARHWAAEGASILHIVDLDGAFQGRPVHTDIIRRIAGEAGLSVEVGGGLRTDDDIDQVLQCGVARAIVGTRALAERGVLERLAGRFGERVALGIDARDGLVQVKGWVETTKRRALDLAREADRAGIRTLICTDTATDGMLGGTNAKSVGAICRAVQAQVIASGGISSPRDIQALKDLGCKNLMGAIVGKALYEGQVTLRELAAAAEAG